METKKFELTSDTKIVFGKKLFRIKALIDFGNVNKGELGGYVEKEENLSHEGNAWAYGDAIVYGNARICGNAIVYGDAEICDDAIVYGNAEVYGNAKVYDDARICGNAIVSGDAEVYGNAKVYDDAEIYGNAWICGDAEIYGDAWICGNAWICGDAEIYGDADYLCFKGLGSCNRNTTFFKCKDGHIHVACGCFGGDLDEFAAKVRETHGNSTYAREYLACIDVVKIHFGIEEGKNGN